MKQWAKQTEYLLLLSLSSSMCGEGELKQQEKRWWFRIKWKMQKRKMICIMLFFLLYSTGNSTQYSVMAYMEKNLKSVDICVRVCVCVCVCVCSVYNWFTLLHSRSYHIIVNQLYSNKTFKNMILAMPCIQFYEQWWKEARNKADGIMQLWTFLSYVVVPVFLVQYFLKIKMGTKMIWYF